MATKKLTIKRLEKVFSYISAETNGCWIWSGGKCEGYGITIDNWRVHRLTYYLVNNTLPSVLDHLCRNRACVNPAHLEAVSVKENLLRGETLAAENSKKTECKRGHKFTPDNTYVFRNTRACRICNREKTKRHYYKKRGLIYA